MIYLTLINKNSGVKCGYSTFGSKTAELHQVEVRSKYGKASQEKLDGKNKSYGKTAF